MISRFAEQCRGFVGVTREIFQPRQFRKRIAICEKAEISQRSVMFLACGDVFAVSRTEPWNRIWLRQREFVGDLDFLKRAFAFIFVKANPSAMRGQGLIQKIANKRKAPSHRADCSRRVSN